MVLRSKEGVEVFDTQNTNYIRSKRAPDLTICHLLATVPTTKSRKPLWELRDEIFGIVEVKTRGSLSEAIGQLGTYLIKLSKEGRPRQLPGLLFRPEKAYLMKAKQGVVYDISHLEWSTPGAKKIIRNYFVEHQEMPSFLQQLCEKTGVTVDNTCGFLGAGAFGRVFRVNFQNKAVALKLYQFRNRDDDKRDMLQYEFEALSLLKGNKNVVQLVSERPVVEEFFGGFLMELGDPREPPDDEFAKAISSLHRAGIVHGDCRKKNLVLVGEQWKWVDFARPLAISRFGILVDVTKALKSLGKGVPRDGSWEQQYMESRDFAAFLAAINRQEYD